MLTYSDALDLADDDGPMTPVLVAPQYLANPEPYALERSSGWWWFMGVLSMASAGVSTYHGYRRHGTVGAAIGWGILGAIFPVITPAVALAQGFGHPKRR